MTDASIVDREIVGFWYIKDINQRMLLQNVTYHEEWIECAGKGAKTITLLYLLEVIVTKGKHIASE